MESKLKSHETCPRLIDESKQMKIYKWMTKEIIQWPKQASDKKLELEQ
jgi:hypothetical protein